jgi:2',3'-cyclic-nucleotide 2'-phosphodiesterase/3'-nucleotidase
MSVAWYADSVRVADGKDNVILLDVGDFLQGDNAAYYYNFVDTDSRHVYARMAEHMGYDAVIVGNHDVETGHAVYDRVTEQLSMPFLASNAVCADGRSYFQDYTIIRRHGVRIAVIGFTNPGIPGWLSPEIWEGMSFEELIPFAQQKVDQVRAKENPHAVVVAVHGGAGSEEYISVENPGLALFATLRGVDLVFCAHDHRPMAQSADTIAVVNAGSHCKYLGQGTINLAIRDGKVVSKSSDASLITIKPENVDSCMKEMFEKEYQSVKEFTLREVGELKVPLRTIDAYTGMSDYINLVHTISLKSTDAQISIAAPLTYDGSVDAGTIVYNDLFTIYPYENQLFVLNMTGAEIKGLLEASYDNWVYTYSKSNPRLLKVRNAEDPRTGQKGWSFVARSYNFDSAAGIVYEVDVTKARGSRINVISMADGSPFNEDSTYKVAMTSYRANGGGGLLRDGAGLDTDMVQERIVGRYPEIRELLYAFIKEHKVIDTDIIRDYSLIGEWKFVPQNIADKALAKDIELMFGQR